MNEVPLGDDITISSAALETLYDIASLFAVGYTANELFVDFRVDYTPGFLLQFGLFSFFYNYALEPGGNFLPIFANYKNNLRTEKTIYLILSSGTMDVIFNEGQNLARDLIDIQLSQLIVHGVKHVAEFVFDEIEEEEMPADEPELEEEIVEKNSKQ